MIDSLKILGVFVLGILVAIFSIFPDFFLKNDFSSYVLYLLMFLVGFGVGSNEKLRGIFKKMSLKIILIPFSVVVGSAAGGVISGIILSDLTVRETLAVSFGFGYYSLSSVIITKIKGETLGVIALLSNIGRELITLALSPVFVKIFGKLAPIASGGATSMDTTLPMVKKYSGEEYVLAAFFSGIILSIFVPFLVTLSL